MNKVNPMDPTLIRAWNKGRKSGEKETTELFYDFLIEKLRSLEDIPGVGEKTTWRVQEHFLKDLEMQEGVLS